MQLIIGPANLETFLIKLIVNYLKLETRGKIKVISLSDAATKAVELGNLKIQIPTLVTQKGQTLTQTFQIARQILSLQPMWAQFFLGSNEAQKNQITNIKTHLKQGKQLRKHLEARTFFVGNHLTFADFFMFSQLYENIVQMTDEQKNQYNNLFRWYKHIQNLPQIKQFLESQNRLLVSDPQQKLTFLEVKKKKKKGE